MMKKAPFSILSFGIATVIFGALTFISFVTFAAMDEGTGGSGRVETFLANLYYVFRFPTHTLFWSAVTQKGLSAFIAGLVFNCLFYGWIAERISSHLINKRKKD